MLPYETKLVDKLKEESEYFTTQVYREVRRSFSIDYELLRGDAVNIGEMLLKLSFDLNTSWQ
jgi:hypothetical protein